jgi:outer membrane murein-binding lipoprotein Lpp
MKKFALFAAAAAGGLALAGCDSEAENQVEQTAEAIDEADEAQADLIEAQEAGGPNEQAAEEQADAIRERGENTKDHLEDEADEMDSTPQ